MWLNEQKLVSNEFGLIEFVDDRIEAIKNVKTLIERIKAKKKWLIKEKTRNSCSHHRQWVTVSNTFSDLYLYVQYYFIVRYKHITIKAFFNQDLDFDSLSSL